MNARELPLPKWTGLAIAGLALVIAITITLRHGLGAALILLAGGVLVLFIWLAFRAIQSVTEPDNASILLEAAPTTAAARKNAALRALKDLDTERGLGNLTDDDYQELVTRYREEAKVAMREVDEERRALRDRAEAIADRTIAKAFAEAEEPEEAANESVARVSESPGEEPRDPTVCRKCTTKNDPDAAFCKRCGEPVA
jgi:hypothetical protein